VTGLSLSELTDALNAPNDMIPRKPDVPYEVYNYAAAYKPNNYTSYKGLVSLLIDKKYQGLLEFVRHIKGHSEAVESTAPVQQIVGTDNEHNGYQITTAGELAIKRMTGLAFETLEKRIKNGDSIPRKDATIDTLTNTWSIGVFAGILENTDPAAAQHLQQLHDAQKQAKQDAEEKAKVKREAAEAQKQAKQDAAEKAEQEAKEVAKFEAQAERSRAQEQEVTERAKEKAAKQAKAEKEAAEKAKREAAEKAKREAAEKAAKQAKAEKEAAEKAKREAAEKAAKQAKAEKEAAEKAEKEAAEKAEKEAAEKAEREAQEKTADKASAEAQMQAEKENKEKEAKKTTGSPPPPPPPPPSGTEGKKVERGATENTTMTGEQTRLETEKQKVEQKTSSHNTSNPSAPENLLAQIREGNKLKPVESAKRLEILNAVKLVLSSMSEPGYNEQEVVESLTAIIKLVDQDNSSVDKHVSALKHVLHVRVQAKDGIEEQCEEIQGKLTEFIASNYKSSDKSYDLKLLQIVGAKLTMVEQDIVTEADKENNSTNSATNQTTDNSSQESEAKTQEEQENHKAAILEGLKPKLLEAVKCIANGQHKDHTTANFRNSLNDTTENFQELIHSMQQLRCEYKEGQSTDNGIYESLYNYANKNKIAIKQQSDITGKLEAELFKCVKITIVKSSTSYKTQDFNLNGLRNSFGGYNSEADCRDTSGNTADNNSDWD
jgi:hypothetical protein